jgi:hypothetical protein
VLPFPEHQVPDVHPQEHVVLVLSQPIVEAQYRCQPQRRAGQRAQEQQAATVHPGHAAQADEGEIHAPHQRQAHGRVEPKCPAAFEERPANGVGPVEQDVDPTSGDQVGQAEQVPDEQGQAETPQGGRFRYSDGLGRPWFEVGFPSLRFGNHEGARD